jgi:hypothetical protein
MSGGRWKKKVFCAPSAKPRRLATRSEGSGEQVAAKISFLSWTNRSPERTDITLHGELAITPTRCANCHMMRSGQPTGVLIPVV